MIENGVLLICGDVIVIVFLFVWVEFGWLEVIVVD